MNYDNTMMDDVFIREMGCLLGRESFVVYKLSYIGKAKVGYA